MGQPSGCPFLRMSDKLINLAVAGPYHNLFTYKARDKDILDLERGCRFLIPFGAGAKVGFFVDYQTEPVEYRLKYPKERIDAASPFPDYLFDFCLWLADYYYAGPGETLAAALPGAGTKRPQLDYEVVDTSYLENQVSGETPNSALARRFLRYGIVKELSLAGDKTHLPIIRDWIERGVIRTRYRVRKKRRKMLGYRLASSPNADLDAQTESAPSIRPDMVYSRADLLGRMGFTAYQITKLLKNEIIERVFDDTGMSDLTTYPIRHELPHMDLLDGQKQALDHILPAVRDNKFAPFLLFGVTGSGKTLVYCHAAREAVEAGGSVLVMVPEIALSGLLLSSFAAFFGDRVAVMHSGLTNSERLAVRERIASGEVRVVIGPRSAIFSPLHNLRLIVIDEEHDPSYKQDDPAPRYNGRDAAVMLARMASCPIILGSASPSIESYQNAITGRYHLLTLDQRPKSGYRMPSIEMLDMKHEKISGDCSFMSYRLKKETEIHLAAGGQVIYYLNRRGFSPRLKCADCGEVPSCPDCGVTLTYHKSGRSLKCHFCDRVEPAPDHCPRCGSGEFLYLGAGTQRVEEVLTRLFENARSVRIDSDRTATKSGRLILGDFAEEKYNLLVGTQMVTKGLDIPGVTLVGVLSADIGLDMPDFRAAEKTYARLLQVAGRAGRGDRDGVVMIQTYYTDHPVIRYLQREGYRPFFDAVIEERRQLLYPPFSRLINITLSGEDEKLLEKEALRFRVKLEERLAGLAAKNRPVGQDPRSPDGVSAKDSASYLQVAGPAPAPMYKLRGSYRRRIFIKTTAIRKIVARLRRWETDEKNFSLPAKIRVIIDVDPVDMM